jgi:hypothetical protein
MDKVTADNAKKLARAFLRHKTWSDQYLHSAKNVIEVLDRHSDWHVVFRHQHWRTQKPGKGIVIVNKTTGTSLWRTPHDNSDTH